MASCLSKERKMSLWFCKDCRKMTWGSSLCGHCGSLNVERMQSKKAKPVKTVIAASPKSAFACNHCGWPTKYKSTFYGDMLRCTNPECRHEEEA